MKDFFVKIYNPGEGAPGHFFLRDETQVKGKHGRHPIKLFPNLPEALEAAEHETRMSGALYNILVAETEET